MSSFRRAASRAPSSSSVLLLRSLLRREVITTTGSTLPFGCRALLFSSSSSTVSKNGTKKQSSSSSSSSFLALAAMSCSALAYYCLPNEDENDSSSNFIAKDPRDDRLALNPHERIAKLHAFVGESGRILAHAKPLTSLSSSSSSASNAEEFGLFSDGAISRKEKQASLKREHGETIVLNVPDAYIVSASTAASDADLGETFTELLDASRIDTRQATQMFVLAQRRLRSESGWKAYVDFLPRRMDVVPVFWTEREVERGLKGTVLYEMVKTQKERLREEYESVVKNAFDMHVVPKLREIIPSSSSPLKVLSSVFGGNGANDTAPLSYEEFVWAKALFWTRALTIPVDNGRVIVEALVPLIDCCNHSTKRPNARYQLSSDMKSVELRVPSKIEDKLTSEDEIKISYGIENLERAFFTYGFVDEDATSTILPFVWNDDEDTKAHASCLELKRLPKIVQLDLENAKKGASAFSGDPEVREALRILGMRGEQLAMELRALLGVKETLTLTPAERASKQERARQRRRSGGLFSSFGGGGAQNNVDADEIVHDHRRLENRGLKRAVETALRKLDETEKKLEEEEEKLGKKENNGDGTGDSTSARRMEEAKRYRKKVREILQAYSEASSKHWKM